MSERRKMFQKIISGSKKKGKEKESSEGLQKHSTPVEEEEQKRCTVFSIEVNTQSEFRSTPEEGSERIQNVSKNIEEKRRHLGTHFCFIKKVCEGETGEIHRYIL